MREDIRSLIKLEGQVSRDIRQLQNIRGKTGNHDLLNDENAGLQILLLQIKEQANTDGPCNIRALRNEFKQIHKRLLNSKRQDKAKAKVKRNYFQKMKRLEKQEKKRAMDGIAGKFDQARSNAFDGNGNWQDAIQVDDLKWDMDILDPKRGKNEEVSGEDLEEILKQITEQASFKSQMKDKNENGVIKDVGAHKLNDKFCLPIVNTFTNCNDLAKYLNESNGDCFELIRTIVASKSEADQCDLLLRNSNAWIEKGDIWVNNQLRSKLRELFLSPKFQNEQCPIAIRKFYADTYFGGKYSLYGKNICDIKSICYRSIVESFRDEAMTKISKSDKRLLLAKFENYSIFDPFAGTGNWALQMCKLVESQSVFLWELETNIFKTIIENNENDSDDDDSKDEALNLHVFNHSFEKIPQIALHEEQVLILLSPPWGKAFSPGIGIDLTKGQFPIINLLQFYKRWLPNAKTAFAIQVDKHISNFGNILDEYEVLLRNEQLLVIEQKRHHIASEDQKKQS